MGSRLSLLATDLEGVYTPEIWIAVAEKTGIEKLRLTTRDEPDYDRLMRGRIAILKEHGLKLRDIQEVIATLDPHPGAREFLDWVRSRCPLIVLSDTFVEFAKPLMLKLNNPTLFCNSLVVDGNNTVVDYTLRQRDGKKHAVIAMKSLNYKVTAIGDSYNDTTMLAEADQGILFRPPANVIAEFPQYPVMQEYRELQDYLETLLG